MKFLYEYLENLKEEKNKGIFFINNLGHEKFISYSELRNHAISFLAWLRKNNINKNDYLILKIHDKELYLTALWACIYGKIKCICTPLDRVDIDKKLLAVKNVYMLIDDKVEILDEKIIRIDYNIFNDFNEDYLIYERDKNDIVFIQYSSGSTSNPKGITLSEKNIITHSLGIELKYGLNKSDSFISWLPLNHNMGLAGFHLTPLIFNVTQIQIDTLFFRKYPLRWFELITKYKVTVAVSNCSVLSLMSTIVSQFNKVDIDLSSLRVIFVAGEKVDFQTISNFYNDFKEYGLTKKMITPSYGLTESTLTVSAKNEDKYYKKIHLSSTNLEIGTTIEINKDNVNNAIVSVGTVLPHICVKIEDLNGNILDDENIGIIKIESESNSNGYLVIKNNNLEIISIKDENGLINTGDIGFIYDSELYVIGRYKEMISINGKNYFYTDVEEMIKKDFTKYRNNIAISTIENIDGIEELALFIDIPIPFEIISTIRKNVIRRLGIDITNCVKVKKFPLTTLGKISRYQLMLNYKNKNYQLYNENLEQSQSLTINSKEDIQRIIIEIIDDMLNKEITLDDSFVEVCQNSMTTTIILKEIVNEIESLGYAVDKNYCIANISKTPTVKDVSSYLFDLIKSRDYND